MNWDESTALKPLGDGRFGAHIDEDWTSLQGVHGGVVAAVAVHASEAVVREIGAPADSAARGEWHHTVVAGLVTELDGLAAVVDAELDPSTARTIALVRADLARLGQ